VWVSARTQGRGGIEEAKVDFDWDPDETALRAEVRELVATAVPDDVAELVPGEDPASDTVKKFTRTLAERGLLAPHWPSEYGGRDASAWQFIILGEELWAAGEPRGSQYMNVNWIGPAIIAAGSDEQKQLHLNRITSGDVFWCQGFSELEAGTDLRSLQTSAVRDGADYLINGTKVWTSYAQHAEYAFVLTRTSAPTPDADGITIFLVPTDTPGLTIERIPSVLDIHEFNRMTFDNVRVPASAMLGPEDHGWATVRLALANERIGGPRYARAARIAERLAPLIEEAPASERPVLRAAVTRARAACAAARLLVYRAIDLRTKDRSDADAVPVARVAIVRAERAVTDLALDLQQRAALPRDSLGNAQFRTTLIAGLGGGSVEVQLNLIAYQLLGSTRGSAA
jgi:alkylation response protein AidB-like acyl-CoA dehydrogenase